MQNKLFCAILLCCSLFYTACFEKFDSGPQTAYQPVYASLEVLRSSVAVSTAKPLELTGKIYRKGDYIFINERYKGIHIIDNSNPELPINIGFITILGNLDLAVKGNFLYADSAIDLVTIDISEPLEAIEVSRTKNVFPQPVAPDNGHFPSIDNKIVVAWQE
jgi:hypothetical protein